MFLLGNYSSIGGSSSTQSRVINPSSNLPLKRKSKSISHNVQHIRGKKLRFEEQSICDNSSPATSVQYLDLDLSLFKSNIYSTFENEGLHSNIIFV